MIRTPTRQQRLLTTATAKYKDDDDDLEAQTLHPCKPECKASAPQRLTLKLAEALEVSTKIHVLPAAKIAASTRELAKQAGPRTSLLQGHAMTATGTCGSATQTPNTRLGLRLSGFKSVM